VTEEEDVEEDSGCENECRTLELYNFVQHVIRGPQLGVLVQEGLHGEHCGGAVVPGSRQDLCGGLCYNEEEAQGDISHLNK
jgi:hypothetical protein